MRVLLALAFVGMAYGAPLMLLDEPGVQGVVLLRKTPGGGDSPLIVVLAGEGTHEERGRDLAAKIAPSAIRMNEADPPKTGVREVYQIYVVGPDRRVICLGNTVAGTNHINWLPSILAMSMPRFDLPLKSPGPPSPTTPATKRSTSPKIGP